MLPGGWTLPLTLLLSAIITRILILLAHRYRWVVPPSADRWHRSPVAGYGGIALVGAFGMGLALLPLYFHATRSAELTWLVVGGMLVFATGLWDDIRPLPVSLKLLGQIIGIGLFLGGLGLLYRSMFFLIGLPALFLWQLGLTNAFNLLDNMDGLAAGTAAIAGALLAIHLSLSASPHLAAVGALIAASCLGFLFFNLRAGGPALIFMGDCGSLFLGCVLAGLVIVGCWGPTTPNITDVAVPMLIMALPIFDTTLVTITRKRAGQPIAQGGKDHASHRLVYAGWSEKQTVAILYGISLVTGTAGVLLGRWPQPLVSLVVVIAFTSAFLELGILLSRYPPPP